MKISKKNHQKADFSWLRVFWWVRTFFQIFILIEELCTYINQTPNSSITSSSRNFNTPKKSPKLKHNVWKVIRDHLVLRWSEEELMKNPKWLTIRRYFSLVIAVIVDVVLWQLCFQLTTTESNHTIDLTLRHLKVDSSLLQSTEAKGRWPAISETKASATGCSGSLRDNRISQSLWTVQKREHNITIKAIR